MDQASLIAALLAGEPEAVGTVQTWIRGAFKPYRGRLGPELEDLEQEILLQLTTSLRDGKFQATSSLATYARSYAHHKCIDRLRAASRRTWVDVEGLELRSPAPSALEVLTRREKTDLALRVQEELPETCREVWRMLVDGLRYGEMSERLGEPEGTLRARVLRCRRRALKIRDRLLAESGRNESDGSTTR